MEIWTRLIEGQNLKLRCRCFATFFLRWCDVCFFVPRCCGVDSPPMSPSLLYLKPLRNSKTFLHVIYKSKKKTNLLCIKNNVFQYSKIRKRNEMRRKALKQKKKLESSPFWNPESTELESGIQYSEFGIHRVKSRIQDCHGFPYMGRRGYDWVKLCEDLLNAQVRLPEISSLAKWWHCLWSSCLITKRFFRPERENTWGQFNNTSTSVSYQCSNCF